MNITKFISFLKDRSGAALVEFSLLLSFLLVSGLGAIEISRAIYQFNVANKGVTAAARYVARLPSYSCDDKAAMETALKAIAEPIAMRASFDSSDPLSLSNWNAASQVTLTVDCIANTDGSGNKIRRGPDEIPVITVGANFPYDSFGILGFLGLESFNITATHNEVYIGD